MLKAKIAPADNSKQQSINHQYTADIMTFCTKYAFALIDNKPHEINSYQIPDDINKKEHLWIHSTNSNKEKTLTTDKFITFGGIQTLNAPTEEKFQRFFQSAETNVNNYKRFFKSQKQSTACSLEHQAYYHINHGGHWVILAISITYDVQQEKYNSGCIEIYNPMLDSQNLECFKYLDLCDRKIEKQINEFSPLSLNRENRTDIKKTQTDVINCGPYCVAIVAELIQKQMDHNFKIKNLFNQGQALRDKQIQWMRACKQNQLIDTITNQTRSEFDMQTELMQTAQASRDHKRRANQDKIDQFIEKIKATEHYFNIVNAWNAGFGEMPAVLKLIKLINKNNNEIFKGTLLNDDNELNTTATLDYSQYLDGLHAHLLKSITEFKHLIMDVIKNQHTELTELILLAKQIEIYINKININIHSNIIIFLESEIKKEITQYIHTTLLNSSHQEEQYKFYYFSYAQLKVMGKSTENPILIAEYSSNILKIDELANIMTCLAKVFDLTNGTTAKFLKATILISFSGTMDEFNRQALSYYNTTFNGLYASCTENKAPSIINTITKLIEETNNKPHDLLGEMIERSIFTQLMNNKYGKPILQQLQQTHKENTSADQLYLCISTAIHDLQQTQITGGKNKTTTDTKPSSDSQVEIAAAINALSHFIYSYKDMEIILLNAIACQPGLLNFCIFLQQPNEIYELYTIEINEHIQSMIKAFPPFADEEQTYNPLEKILTTYIEDHETCANQEIIIGIILDHGTDFTKGLELVNLLFPAFSGIASPFNYLPPAYKLELLLNGDYSHIKIEDEKKQSLIQIDKLIMNFFRLDNLRNHSYIQLYMLKQYSIILNNFPVKLELVRNALAETVTTEHIQNRKDIVIAILRFFGKLTTQLFISNNPTTVHAENLTDSLADTKVDCEQLSSALNEATQDDLYNILAWLKLFIITVKTYESTISKCNIMIQKLISFNNAIQEYLDTHNQPSEFFIKLINTLQQSLILGDNIHSSHTTIQIFNHLMQDLENKHFLTITINYSYQFCIKHKDNIPKSSTLKEIINMFLTPDPDNINLHIDHLSKMQNMKYNIFHAQTQLYLITNAITTDNSGNKVNLFVLIHEKLTRLANTLLKKNNDVQTPNALTTVTLTPKKTDYCWFE